MSNNGYPESVDVVIAGAGITGASSLYHIVKDSDLNVLCLEAKGANYGSTARSAAAFRHQFSSRVNVQMSLYSGRVYSRFHEDFDTEKLLIRNGYLFMYSDEERLEVAAENVEFQREMGVENVRVLEPDEVREKFPHIEAPDLVGATWCPDDGFIRPELASREFINAAFRYENTSLEQKSKVTNVEVTGNEVTAVEVNNDHRIETGCLVNAAGAWCNQIAGSADVKLPVVPVKRYLYFTNQFEERDVTDFPLHVINLGPYFRPEHNGLMMGWDRKPQKPEEFEQFLDSEPDYEDLYIDQDRTDKGFGLGIDGYGYELLAEAAEWIPFLNKSGLENVSSGFYQITPDEKAIVSRDPRVKGLVHAVGFSGHGVMHAPATGKAVADIVLERTSDFDLDTLELDPLLEGNLRPDAEDMVI